jgi:hypothetical protein
MMEAFESMHVAETRQLRPSDVDSVELYDGATFIPTKDDDLFNVDLEIVLYDQDGNHNTTDDQIRLDGNFAFSAAIFAEIEIYWFELKKFEVGIESGQDVNVDLTANLQWEFGDELEFDLAEFHLGAIWIGPIVLVPTLTVEAHIHGDLTITFETGISYSHDLRCGFGWEDEWYLISEFTNQFDYTPPQFNVEFNFEPGVSLNASVMVYGLAGPYVGLKAGFHFLAALGIDPCNFDLTVDLEAILYAIVGIECDLLGLDYNWDWELYTHLIGEWIFPLGGSGTIVVDPEPDSINAPWSLTGPCSYNESGNGDDILTGLNPGDYSVTWGDVSGWTKPSNSTQNLAADDTLTFLGTYVEEVTTTEITR